MAPDKPDEPTVEEPTGQDTQPPTTLSPEWAFENQPLFAKGGGEKGDPPSTVDLETRNDDD